MTYLISTLSSAAESPPSVRSLLSSLTYGPAPESPAVAKAWLEDHGNSLGHFINGSWVRPEGRKTYDTYNPATGEKLASTVQGHLTTISLWNFCYISPPNLHLCHILTPPQPHTSLHVLQSIMSVCVSDCHLTPLPLGVQEDADLAVSAARKAFDS